MSNTTNKVATRKGINYYRNIFDGSNISKAIATLPEVIKKYGYKRWSGSNGNDILRVRKYTEFNWNHQIVAFFLPQKGSVCIDIYWQGDSTDGNDSLYVSECVNGKTIPAEHEFIGGRTYYTHSDIRVSREELVDAIKAIGKYLAPDEVKARKEADRKGELQNKIYDFIAAEYKDRDERYWNGRYGVQQLLTKEPTLLNKTFDELNPIIKEVFDNNNKTDYTLRGCRFDGEKKYNLSYKKVG